MKKLFVFAFVFSWAVSAMAINFGCKTKELSAASDLTKKEKFYSAEGKFKIMFPGEPVRTEEVIPTEVEDITMVMFMFEKSQAEVFLVAYLDYPAEKMKGRDPYVVLDASKNGILSNLSAIEQIQKKFKISGFPAISFEGKGSTFGTSYLLVLRNNRLYQVGIINSGSMLSKSDAKSFIKSFELTD